MKYYLISNMYPSNSQQGYGVFVKNVQEGLEQKGCVAKSVTVISGRKDKKLDKLLSYINFYSSILFNYFRKYDFIYVHYPSYSAPLLNFLAKLYSHKIIVNFHGEDLIYPTRNRFSRFLGKCSEYFVRNHANIVIVPSEYFKNVLLTKKLIDPNSIIVSPSGGINKFFLKNNIKQDNEGLLTLGFVGRLQSDKGIFEYIRACIELSKKIRLKAYIIGYGPEWNRVCNYTKVFDFFEIHKGMTQNQLSAYYEKFDVFCFPSKRPTESLGLVGIEAMGSGVPVIGTNIGGIPTYLKDGFNGYLINTCNLEDNLIKNILKFIELDTTSKREMRTNALKTAQIYSQELVCEKLLKDIQIMNIT